MGQKITINRIAAALAGLVACVQAGVVYAQPSPVLADNAMKTRIFMAHAQLPAGKGSIVRTNGQWVFADSVTGISCRWQEATTYDFSKKPEIQSVSANFLGCAHNDSNDLHGGGREITYDVETGNYDVKVDMKRLSVTEIRHTGGRFGSRTHIERTWNLAAQEVCVSFKQMRENRQPDVSFEACKPFSELKK